MNVHTTKTGAPAAARGGTMKFTYPSGSSPLAGYTIKRGIGQGGFGEVYYATSDAGKEVALKLIRRNLDVELRGVRQCLNLKHANLVGLYDIRTDDQDDRWVVMEYVCGESLEDALERNPNGMPVDQVLYWMHGIAAGVAYLHDHGIVHRDLKPGNIFADEGVVKIGDYGLSKFISCSRRSGQTESVGTVHYMAPEIANGRYGREIDTYALGIILHEMLLGRVPFEGESVGEVLMKHLTAQPDLSGLEEPYRTIVAQTLAKDPEARLKSAAELLAMLPPRPPAATPAAILPADNPVAATAAIGPPAGPAAGPAIGRHASREPSDEMDGGEPILRTIRRGWQDLATEWNRANMHPALRVAILVGAILLLIVNAGWWVPLVLVALACYAVYWVIRTLVIASHRRRRHRLVDGARGATQAVVERNETPQPASDETRAHKLDRRRRRWQRLEREAPVIKPAKQKLTELTGSMLLAAAIVLTMSVVMAILHGQMHPAQFTWIALVSTFGAWAVLVPSKAWEGIRGDQALRRFVMLCVGLATGGVAYGLANALLVELPNNRAFGGRGPFALGFYDPRGVPTALAYLAYFGFLFLIIRWWHQVDPSRAARLSLWITGSCVFWAWLLSQFWQFPQPWGLMSAAVISVAIQLASPWAPPHRPGGWSEEA